MQYVFLIEDDPKIQNELGDAIFKVDKKLQVAVFPSLEQFSKWIKMFLESGPQALAVAGTPLRKESRIDAVISDDDRLALIISDNEIFGSQHIKLIRRFLEMVKQKGASNPDHLPSFLVTAFESPNFDFMPLQTPEITNVLFKPFDQLILTQLISFALSPGKSPAKAEVYNLQTDAVVEMLKDVELEHISDLGFTTRAKRMIDVGSFGKYYGANFTSPTRTSVFAKCVECIPHPVHKGEFQALFSYFGNNVVQISQLKKLIKRSAFFNVPFQWNLEGPTTPKTAIIVGSGTPDGQDLMMRLKNQYSNINFCGYRKPADFLYEVQTIDLVKEQKSAEKAFPTSNPVKLHFDAGGSFVLGSEPAMGSGRWLSHTEDDLKTVDFATLVQDNQKGLWIRTVGQKTIQKDKDIFVIHTKTARFFIKVLTIEQKQRPGTKDVYIVETREATEDEIAAFMQANSTLPRKVDMMFLISDAFGGDQDRVLNVVQGALTRYRSKTPGEAGVPIFYVCKDELSYEASLKFAPLISDVFLMPLDTTYVFRKLTSYIAGLSEKEHFETATIEFPHIIRVANPIKITEISEAALMMEYKRPIARGSFRRFLMWKPNEQEMQEVHAVCHSSTAGSDGLIQNQFVYFGVTDTSLKEIRLWIRNNYIESKHAS